MGWDPAFLADLARPFRTMRILLQHVGVPATVLRPYGGGIRFSSWPIAGWDAVIRADGSSVSGGMLAVRDWTATPLTFDVGITDAAIRDVRTVVQRGQVVALKVGFGDDVTQFTTVAIGTVRGISWSPSGWVIRCVGLEGSLTTRWTTTAGEQALGHDLLSTTTTEAVTAAETDIDLASVTGLQTAGVVEVTADDGSTYLISYTGISTLTLTGCTTPAFGTTFSTTSNGAAVAQRMYATGHPLEIAAKVLESTGAATNGTWDTLPASWGFGLPAALVDERDILRHVGIRQPSSGVDDWAWIQAATTNPQQTLSAWLAGGGYYLTQRQGQITARGGVLPWDTSNGAGVVITDGDVVSVDGYETWDPDQPVEYRICRITDASGTNEDSAASALDHLPALGTYTHAPGGIYSTTTNRTAIVAELVSTLKHWDQRVPEWLSLTLRGRWWGHLAPGDSVPLSLSFLASRTGGAFGVALVTRASVDWFGPEDVARVEMLILPADESVPWRPIA